MPRPDMRSFRRPKSNSPLAYYSWRVRVWVEGTFALSVMEPWEKFLVLFVFLVLISLLLTSIIRFLPSQLINMHRRMIYYLWGGHDPHKSMSLNRLALPLRGNYSS
ncbi:hypothetical protein L218DRAFT_865074 [Marasmius fiardii PR-910]|nr:hypothetical protein L218DRAFT_865074 [Marasmius fiardii PR-910]